MDDPIAPENNRYDAPQDASHDTPHCAVQWANETLHLLPEHAVWWPAAQTLFIADIHLGKAASYRKLGQPVPAGSTHDNLQRLSRLIERHAPQHIVFLGDFLHAATGRTPAMLQALRTWRDQHAALRLTLVRGNHDSHAGDPPSELGIAVVDEPLLIGPFAACHHPQVHATHFVLAGHSHPVVHLYGTGRDSLRLPCFVQDDGRQAVLPAFGGFTGGHAVGAQPGRCIYAVGGGRVWAIPSSNP
nr:ligase-associated DNA damage response endonuclease PdeM [Rhodoferax sp.]